MGIEKYLGGQFSPMDTGKKDKSGVPTGETDMTEEEAKKATDRLTAEKAEEAEEAKKLLGQKIDAIRDKGGMA